MQSAAHTRTLSVLMGGGSRTNRCQRCFCSMVRADYFSTAARTMHVPCSMCAILFGVSCDPLWMCIMLICMSPVRYYILITYFVCGCRSSYWFFPFSLTTQKFIHWILPLYGSLVHVFISFYLFAVVLVLCARRNNSKQARKAIP